MKVCLCYFSSRAAGAAVRALHLTLSAHRHPSPPEEGMEKNLCLDC